MGSDAAVKSCVTNINSDKKTKPIDIFDYNLGISESLCYVERNYQRFNYYQYGSGLPNVAPDDRMVVFFTDDITGLEIHKCWAVDGTFNVCPGGWAQLLRLGIIVNHEMVTLAYCLAPNKEQITYEKFIDIILKRIPNAFPNKIILDFEIGLKNAFASKFPHADLHGCYFHLSQAILKRVKKNKKLYKLYVKGGVVGKYIGVLKSLSYILPPMIRETLQDLKNESDYPKICDGVYRYFEKVYVGKDSKSATYELEFWNNSDMLLHNHPLTNNGVEGSNYALNNSFNVTNYSNKTFIKKLIENEGKDHIKYQQIAISGENRRNKRSVTITDTINQTTRKQVSPTLCAFIEHHQSVGTKPIKYIFDIIKYIKDQ